MSENKLQCVKAEIMFYGEETHAGMAPSDQESDQRGGLREMSIRERDMAFAARQTGEPDKVIAAPSEPDLNEYESVREHLRERLTQEVSDLEARVRHLHAQNAPHTAIMLNSYQRVIQRKKAFLDRWCADA